MRKVFVVLIGLILSAYVVGCSEDETTVEPRPPVEELDITTSSVPVGYTCSPYNVDLEATGGTEPYAWALADGSDPLPTGLTLSADGNLIGVIEDNGEWTFTVEVTDNASTPDTDTQEYTFSVEEPDNPSLTIYFDGEATICQGETQAMTNLDCYVFVMPGELEDENCVYATEFMIRITNTDDEDLDAGSEYAILNAQYPDYVVAMFGSMFNGIAITFNRPVYGPDPIWIASFGLLLMEDFDQLSFKFVANPGGSLAIADCTAQHNMIPVTSREIAVNY